MKLDSYGFAWLVSKRNIQSSVILEGEEKINTAIQKEAEWP